jgi:hypothetical protein
VAHDAAPDDSTERWKDALHDSRFGNDEADYVSGKLCDCAGSPRSDPDGRCRTSTLRRPAAAYGLNLISETQPARVFPARDRPVLFDRKTGTIVNNGVYRCGFAGTQAASFGVALCTALYFVAPVVQQILNA